MAKGQQAGRVHAGDREISPDMRLERNIGADSRGKKHQADIFIIIHIAGVPAEYEIKIVITGRRP